MRLPSVKIFEMRSNFRTTSRTPTRLSGRVFGKLEDAEIPRGRESRRRHLGLKRLL